MIWATLSLAPTHLIVASPWTVRPSAGVIARVVALSVLGISVVLLGESPSVPVGLGLAAALVGVALINFQPSSKPLSSSLEGKGA